MTTRPALPKHGSCRQPAGARLFAAVAAALLFSLGAWNALHAAHYGLMVGIDHYDPAYGAGDLPSCINDADGFRARLLNDASRWQAVNLVTLTDGSASKSAVRNTLQQFASLAVPGDVVVYYHSSHGGTRGGTDTFLCTYNANYEDYEIAADLATFADGVTIVVVVDACHSGGLFKSAGVAAAPTWNLAANVMRRLDSTKAAAADKGPDVGWLTACNYDQTCWAGDPYSLFTAFVLDAFASGDANQDGNISFDEIFDYAAPRATAVNRTQTAQVANEALLASTIAAGLPLPLELGDALDATSLAWQQGGAAQWFGQSVESRDGIDAGQSGDIGDGQASWMEASVEGPGTLTFWWSVSSEASYDYLRFALDGTPLASISGSMTWQQRTVAIPAGSHTVRWLYEKDNSVSSGADCGRVDQVVWEPAGACRLPLKMAGRWAGIQVWDATAGQWVVNENRFAPEELVLPAMQPGRWYWVGVWDFGAQAYIYSGWSGRMQ